MRSIRNPKGAVEEAPPAGSVAAEVEPRVHSRVWVIRKALCPGIPVHSQRSDLQRQRTEMGELGDMKWPFRAGAEQRRAG